MGAAGKIALNISVVLLALIAGFYQIYLKHVLAITGVYPARVIEPLANTDCKTVPELQACEKIILHQPTGVIYLACSTPSSRAHWIPAANQLNATGASNKDYVATYDPATSRITRLATPDFNNGRGLSLHGMDVVPSESNLNELFIYLVNHRTPIGDKPAQEVGADSVIEVFKAQLGGASMEHVKTVSDPIIVTPNDVLGSADGKSFYFTNDHAARVGLSRHLEILGHKGSSIGYCHIDEGCKYSLDKTHSSNGITSAPNGTIYVSDSIFGGVTALERQTDNTLVVAESISTERVVDGISFDANGQLWGATTPQGLTALKHFGNPKLLSPSSVHRISINTGVNAFYGEKYKVEKTFEDDGTLISGITTVAYDSQRKKLFLHGIASPQLAECNI
ncbi:calcium-dependent phosphotriesterase [Agrocybe pediades]|nr:calcium-dependent phosphotriesterase [Agrocybe pediades]